MTNPTPFRFTEDERNELAVKLGGIRSMQERIDLIESIVSNRVEADGFRSEWQKCPKCDGQGTVSRPPWITGDVYEWSSTSVTYQCNVCNGAMIIPSPSK